MSKKVYVKDLTRGSKYSYYNYRTGKPDGILQYIGPTRHIYVNGDSWKTHRFLWIKKPETIGKINRFKGKAFITIFGDGIRGILGFI